MVFQKAYSRNQFIFWNGCSVNIIYTSKMTGWQGRCISLRVFLTFQKEREGAGYTPGSVGFRTLLYIIKKNT